MYLARVRSRGQKSTQFIIRESFPDPAGKMKSRDLFDLGTDPGAFIIYPGGNSYYIRTEVEDALVDQGARFQAEDLEDLFWPFLEPGIKHAVEHFKRRSDAARKRKTPAPDDGKGASVHLFDKRRMHYLRFGVMEQGNIGRMPPVLLRPLAGKSRDEIEQKFIQLEDELRARERKTYLFVSLNLQRFFSQRFAKEMPQALDQAEVDDFFTTEICRLNRDPEFWQAEDPPGELHEYLVRYVIMFFDHDYAQSRYLEDVIDNIFAQRRHFFLRAQKEPVSLEQAAEIFGVKAEALKEMTAVALTKLYRRRARRFHPDTGGSHDKFIRLTQAYQALIRRR